VSLSEVVGETANAIPVVAVMRGFASARYADGS
jgi:hypothetical protein